MTLRIGPRTHAILTATCWTLCGLLLLAAAGFPFVYSHVYVAGLKADMQDVLSSVVSAQQRHLITKERYVSFSDLQMTVTRLDIPAPLLSDDRFSVMAWENGGSMLLQATTTPAATAEGWLPPMALLYRLDDQGRLVQQTWSDQPQ